MTSGLKIYVNREPSYFSSTDTTKKPGCPGDLHRYFYIRPAYDYARRNSLSVVQSLEVEVLKYEGGGGLQGIIAERFSNRTRDERVRLSIRNESNK